MVRSSGWSLLVVVVAVFAAACGPKPAAKSAAVDPEAGGDGSGEVSRGEIEMELRQRLARVEGDACAKQDWLKERVPKARGLEAEVTEELLAEHAGACRRVKAAAADGAPAAPAAPADGAPAAPAAGAPATAIATVSAAPAAPAPAPAAGAPATPPPAAPTPAASAPPPQASAAACTRRRAETDLRAKTGRAPTRGQIETEFQRCFRDRLAACQFALDADVDEGLACWKQAPWPEVPASVPPEEIATTGMCLVELKAIITDVRRCRAKKPADLDPCVAPYIGYAPQCALLKADRVWRMFPGREDIERAARTPTDPKAAKLKAEQDAKEAKLRAEQEAKEQKLKAEQEAKAAREAKLKADQEAKEQKLRAEQEAKEQKLKAEQEAKRAAEEAKIAKETERCFGRTTLEFAERLRAAPGPRTVPNCKYQAVGRVVSQNNVFVQLVDPSGGLIFLLRTKEPFPEGTQLSERTATFETVEEAELADGSKRPFAVFKLEPAPAPKK